MSELERVIDDLTTTIWLLELYDDEDGLTGFNGDVQSKWLRMWKGLAR